MTAAPDRLGALARDHPEWRPWLRCMGAALAEASRPVWTAQVPASPPLRADAGRPLLAGVALPVDTALTRRWVAALLDAAAASGSAASAGLGALTRRPRFEPVALLEAAIQRDAGRLAALAAEMGAEPTALQAVADLAPLPLLQSCARRWRNAVPAAWRRGYCPVCGAWPALAEARGVARARHLRCARCGGDWETDWLRCPYCETREHVRLGGLVEDGGGERRRVETCECCHGYVKTLATLTGSPGEAVLLDDLATVDLDIAALAAGYRRPPGAGYSLDIRIVPGRSRVNRLFTGRA